MHKIDAVDLEFLYLAVSREGGFNEKDVARSELGQLGVGKVLDRLAVLKEGNLLRIGDNGSFRITDVGKQIFWGKDIPAETRILMLLKIKSLTIQDIARYLLEPEQHISEEIESLRARGFVMFTTIRRGERIEKMCEIMQEGLNRLDTQSATHNVATIQETLSEIARKTRYIEDEKKLEVIAEKLRDILKQL